MTIEELKKLYARMGWQTNDNWQRNDCFHFGKHKRHTVWQVSQYDAGYLKWVTGPEFLISKWNQALVEFLKAFLQRSFSNVEEYECFYQSYPFPEPEKKKTCKARSIPRGILIDQEMSVDDLLDALNACTNDIQRNAVKMRLRALCAADA